MAELRPGYANPLSERLDPGEQLLWYGRPRQGVVFRASDLLLVPFSLLWCGFAVFWEASVLGIASRGPAGGGRGVPLFMALFGLPFVAVGLYMVVGRFFVDAHVRRNTHYGVTDRRAVIVSGVFSRKTTSIDLGNVSAVELTEHADGTGTITFGPQPVFARAAGGFSQGTPWPGFPTAPAFDRVADAAEAYRLIRGVREAGGPGPGFGPGEPASHPGRSPHGAGVFR